MESLRSRENQTDFASGALLCNLKSRRKDNDTLSGQLADRRIRSASGRSISSSGGYPLPQPPPQRRPNQQKVDREHATELSCQCSGGKARRIEQKSAARRPALFQWHCGFYARLVCTGAVHTSDTALIQKLWNVLYELQLMDVEVGQRFLSFASGSGRACSCTYCGPGQLEPSS